MGDAVTEGAARSGQERESEVRAEVRADTRQPFPTLCTLVITSDILVPSGQENPCVRLWQQTTSGISVGRHSRVATHTHVLAEEGRVCK